MALITTSNVNIILQTIEKLLSFKIDRSEIPDEDDALELLSEMGFIGLSTDSDGAIFVDEDGNILSL